MESGVQEEKSDVLTAAGSVDTKIPADSSVVLQAMAEHSILHGQSPADNGTTANDADSPSDPMGMAGLPQVYQIGTMLVGQQDSEGENSGMSTRRKKNKDNWRSKLNRTSFSEQRLTKSCQLRIDMTQGARTMGIKRLVDHSSADNILYKFEGIAAAFKKQQKQKRVSLPPQRTTNAFEWRKKWAKGFKEDWERRIIEQNTIVQRKEPPPDDPELVPHLTNTSCLRAGLTQGDLAVTLRTLKWSTLPGAKEPMTKVTIKPDKRFGRNKGMGWGSRFRKEVSQDIPGPGTYPQPRNTTMVENLVGSEKEDAKM